MPSEVRFTPAPFAGLELGRVKSEFKLGLELMEFLSHPPGQIEVLEDCHADKLENFAHPLDKLYPRL